MGTAFKIDFRVRRLESRSIRQGKALIFQHRIIIVDPLNTDIIEAWETISSIPNYGDVYDDK